MSKVKQITEDAKKRGFDVRIRDIAYAALRVTLGDELIAYTVVFGAPEKDSDVTEYDALESVNYLARWFESELSPKEAEKANPEDIVKALKKQSRADDIDGEESITFEENRAGIERQIEEILDLKKQLVVDGEVTDIKTMAVLHKTEADLRSKLNDKFGAAEKSSEQYVIVQKKFDFVCPHTRRECYQMTKEDAMKKWNLKQ